MTARNELIAIIAWTSLLASPYCSAANAGIQRLPATGTIEAAFTPGDAIDNLLIDAIDGAKGEVLVHAYSFTHRRIARALVRAHQRGVSVAVIADREQARALPQNALPDLVAGGVGVCLDGNFQAAHNKIIVIDAESEHAITITGSYNFTLAAQRNNAENVIVLRENPMLARVYRSNWQRLKAACTPWSDAALK